MKVGNIVKFKPTLSNKNPKELLIIIHMWPEYKMIFVRGLKNPKFVSCCSEKAVEEVLADLGKLFM